MQAAFKVMNFSLFGFQGAKTPDSNRKPAKRLWFEEETQRNERAFAKAEARDMELVSTICAFSSVGRATDS